MDERVKILVVEDEILLSQDIEIRLSQMGYRVTGTAQSVEKALEVLELQQPDLAILDIMLKGEKDGIELGRIINENYGIPFIFLSSHADKHLVERAKEVLPYAYMLKPFNDREIQIAIELALTNFSNNTPEKDISAKHNFSDKDNQVLPVKDSFFLKKDYHFERVNLKDILWLEAESNYTVFYTVKGKFIYSTVLKNIEEKLPKPQFLRVHRSYIVNIENVIRFDRSMLYIGDKSIPVSKNYQDSVFKWFETI